jgi:hypothetical protein
VIKVNDSIVRKLQLLFLIGFSNLITVINYLLDWPLVKFANFRVPDFTDSQPLKSIECFGSLGLNVYDIENPAFPDCGYNYGSILLVLGKVLGLNGGIYRQVSIIFALLVSTIIAIVLGNYLTSNLKLTYFLVFVLVTSPPISFLFERGNFDQLIFILIFVAAFAQANKWRLLSLIIIALTALIKFYSFPLLVLFVIANWRFVNKFILIFTPILTFIMIFLDISRITWFPSTGGCCQFGGASFSYYFRFLGMTGHQDFWIITGVAILILGALVILKLPIRLFPVLRNTVDTKSNTMTTIQIFIEWTSLIVITSYIAGFNYDYRLVFYVTGGLIIFQKITEYSTSNVVWALLFITSLWGTIGLGSEHVSNSITILVIVTLFQIIGDLSLYLVVSYMVAFFIKEFLLISLKKYLLKIN